ncbi:stalk domain-containing protein [Alkaliphilus peptidifermentans]|uniref:Copper amine oxidase N-terminal domain-containing protein n=1 Tax=Alkaliphilus peptidifermentans DSM 18978 TaxID=1120976 RepID=A0A1G5ADV9_9FIRM|nr:stalk domain-containing protein [Alkaliphilus peptidifermentans]SCX76047.1 Copper amine oxidase N-terminal domain-containing protein [Alkaliphilus peptidifermentans DSM 18978]
MKKKAILIVLVIFIGFTIVAAATTINGEYRGFPIVIVRVNGEVLKTEVPAINFFGKTMLPVRDIGETFDAAIAWDGQTWTVDLVKPEVEMLFIDQLTTNEAGDSVLVNPFKASHSGEKSFQLYLQMDKLPKGRHTYRIVVIDPKGDTIKRSEEFNLAVNEDNKVGFYQTIDYEDFELKHEGEYSFQFQLKIRNEFKTVYEKALMVIEGQ